MFHKDKLHTKWAVFLFRALVVIVTLLLTLCCVFYLVEHVFFDKFVYQKSSFWGYVPSLHAPRQDYFTKQRYHDLRNLFEPESVSTTTPDTFVVAVLGDSVPFGVGVRESEAFPALLEKKLNVLRPTKVYKLNQPGDGILDNYTKFTVAEKTLHPNVYIVGVVENDLLIDDLSMGQTETENYPGNKNFFDLFSQRCPGPLFKYSWENIYGFSDAVQKNFYPSVSSQFRNICMLNEMTKAMTQENSSIIFYDFQFYPQREYSDENEVIRENRLMRQTMDSAIEKNDGYVIGMNILEHSWENVSQLEGHPSRNIHQIFAQQLFEEITKNPRWKFKK